MDDASDESYKVRQVYRQVTETGGKQSCLLLVHKTPVSPGGEDSDSRTKKNSICRQSERLSSYTSHTLLHHPQSRTGAGKANQPPGVPPGVLLVLLIVAVAAPLDLSKLSSVSHVRLSCSPPICALALILRNQVSPRFRQLPCKAAYQLQTWNHGRIDEGEMRSCEGEEEVQVTGDSGRVGDAVVEGHPRPLFGVVDTRTTHTCSPHSGPCRLQLIDGRMTMDDRGDTSSVCHPAVRSRACTASRSLPGCLQEFMQGYF